MSLNQTVSLLSKWTAVHSRIRARVAEAQVLQQSMAMASSEPRLLGIQAAKLNTVVTEICAQVPVLYKVLEAYHPAQDIKEEGEEGEEDDAMAVVLGLAGAQAKATADRAFKTCLGDMDQWHRLCKAYSVDMEIDVDEFLAKTSACGADSSAMLAEIKARLELLAQDRRAKAAEEESRHLM
ncbi:hypothetical protein IW140_006200 [Coemansia sp. RSA 1813]|nr:hypothetical protein EV178_006210 [Coemansia sp. RSA 1646]KAJ1766513.1 hypothetical protein LPJ74_005855 [Coemansia sp. RSA 1843]KAJ2085647.1 hypothetical protein IW138_006194 [Coemansia sp. RSA 986]KAJ2210540.1 hypothetical protein EV179_006164 [Coemansia sp. RSA 487]KAJ2563182.1 hypothetical protein IW140_006200 [Coemansia sp. RSA 1813]